MKYYEIRQSDMTVMAIIDTSTGDIVAVRSGAFLLAFPVVATMVAAGNYASDQAALEANGYVWGIPI